MKKLVKKMLGIILTMSLLQVSPVAASNQTTVEKTLKDAVIDMAFPSGTDLVFEEKKINTGVSSKSAGLSDTILVAKQTDGDDTIITTILPYAIVDNNLVNSYAQKDICDRTRLNNQLNSTFVDVTVTSVYTYRQMFSILNAENYYRTTSVYAYWNSNNSTVSVSNMYITYEIYGNKYTDNVETVAENNCLIETNYHGSMSINRNSPTKNNHYSAAKSLPTEGYVCAFKNYMSGHGLFTYIKLTYSVNGNTRTDDKSNYLIS